MMNSRYVSVSWWTLEDGAIAKERLISAKLSIRRHKRLSVGAGSKGQVCHIDAAAADGRVLIL